VLEKTIALRIDVDTAIGLKKGVPRLLDIFQKHRVCATFFIVAGPDSMGRHIFRFRRKGYIKRILSVNPFKLISNYGLRPFFYGTLIKKTPFVAGSAPEVLGRISEEGNEIGLHAYNHAEWADRFDKFTADDVRDEFDRAFSEYERLLGSRPLSSACPNWRCTETILAEEDRYEFLYLSDLRGTSPFFPLVDGAALRTVQIPQTMPTFHECLQAGACSHKNMVDYMLKKLKKERLNVFTLHDWAEGISYPCAANEFIEKAQALGFAFTTLESCAKRILEKRDMLPKCRISLRTVPGGIGKVSCQEDN